VANACGRDAALTFDATDVALSLVKIAIVLGALLNVTPIMVWVERRGSALIQDRLGPNRVGPFGLFQAIADALKFLLKEDVIPAQAHKWLYTLAPMFGLIPALTTIAVVPWGRPFLLEERMVLGHTIFQGGRWFEPIVADVNVGLLVVFALASLSVYGIVTAGWSSNNKYSLFGGIRASAQMISYELALTVAAVSALMVAGSLRLVDVVQKQAGYFVLFNTIKLPAWNVLNPAMFLSFVIFTIAAFAETNRLPFDFAEADAELVAGYHTEYSSMKFALFFMSEYMSMATISALIVTLFFGGWDIPWYNEPPTFLGFLLSAIFFVAKVATMLFVFVWVRWTIPRLKYDILMKIGWKVFLPLAVLNIVIVALFIAAHWI
jgi:NADH-quinone oxidoreductase subunit H